MAGLLPFESSKSGDLSDGDCPELSLEVRRLATPSEGPSAWSLGHGAHAMNVGAGPGDSVFLKSHDMLSRPCSNYHTHAEGRDDISQRIMRPKPNGDRRCFGRKWLALGSPAGPLAGDQFGVANCLHCITVFSGKPSLAMFELKQHNSIRSNVVSSVPIHVK